jgi:hypothetical protein
VTWGANAIYDIVDGKLEFRSYFKMPAPQVETENCVAHNGSIVPVPGRDIFVQAWYQGGISVIDFTDSANPVEIAYFDRGPILEDELITGGFWSVYYYEGAIYGTEITRGLDVFKLLPSEFLSDSEIAAAALATPAVGPKRLFNPQQQVPVTWPADPVVARAYLDQLLRDDVLDADTLRGIDAALAEAETVLSAGNTSMEVAGQLSALSGALAEIDADGIQASRVSRLGESLDGIARRLGEQQTGP